MNKIEINDIKIGTIYFEKKFLKKEKINNYKYKQSIES